jgi:N-formylglutamate amidohydrolase
MHTVRIAGRLAVVLLAMAGVSAVQADPSAPQPAKPNPVAASPATTQPAVADDSAEPGKPLITVARGGLPIIISAPHGGRSVVKDTPGRKGAGVDRFVAGGDSNTYELAMRIADGLEKEFGQRPYIVFARFQRKFADANRDPKNAYEHDNAKFHYDAYHAALAEATAEVRKRWGRGLLLDVHGQAVETNGIFRGTRDGKACTDLIEREGVTAVIGPKSIFGQFAQKGYPIFPKPENDALGTEVRYNGGFITEHYGSHNGTSIDAIQLEFGSNLRKQSALDKTAGDAVAAIATFARAYLPAMGDKQK